MYEEIKIFIPTKNRLYNEKTYNILKELGLNPILVVEPQEYEEANKLHYNCLKLEKNNQGISYARNYILEFCRLWNIEYVCMLDDDIQFFGEIVPIRKRRKNNKAFLMALDKFLEFKTCGTMQYNQFAWCQPKPIVYNRGIEVVWFLYMPQLKDVIIENDTIEDRDFSLDIILNHRIKTFRLNHLYFQVPSIGTNKGGIETNTRAQKQEFWSHKMQIKWGQEIIEIIKKTNGCTNIKINWRYIDKLLKQREEENKQCKLNFDAFSIISPNPKYEQLQFAFMKEI